MDNKYTYLNSLMLLAIIFMLGANTITTNLNQKRLNVHSKLNKVLSERVTLHYNGQEKINVAQLQIMSMITGVDITPTMTKYNKLKDSNGTN